MKQCVYTHKEVDLELSAEESVHKVQTYINIEKMRIK